MKTLHVSRLVLLLIPFSLSLTGNTQNVAINTTGASADPSALLDMKSTTAGVLIPRMNTAQRNAISSPAVGLQIFNTDCDVLNYWTGTCWVSAGAIPAPDSISSSVSTILCAGATATYSIPAITGATAYYWTVPPGARITSGQGTTSINVTYNNVSGNVCVTANDACETSQPTCRAVQVNSSPVSVSITATPSGTVSPGSNVTFTAIPVNGGPTPTYQWMNGSNAVGTNSPTYTSTFTNGNVITCIMTTSNTACVTGSPATSNAITMSVTTPVTLNMSTPIYNGRQLFTFTGANQTFTVPSYVTSVFVKMWGAGGGSGGSASGGGGAFVSGYLTVTANSTLTVVVGGAGGYTISTINTPGGFGGGAPSGAPTAGNYAGSGGGRSAVQIISGQDAATAGGGGGAGTGSYNQYAAGGGGGNPNGVNGYSILSSGSGHGNGGTTSAGGAASTNGNTNSVAASSVLYTYTGSAGANNTYPGGGGGGGYFGGSGGCGNTSSSNVPVGGGGGGASFTTNLTTVTNFAGPSSSTTSTNTTSTPTDVDYISPVAVGGGINTNSGNGEVVIYW